MTVTNILRRPGESIGVASLVGYCGTLAVKVIYPNTPIQYVISFHIAGCVAVVSDDLMRHYQSLYKFYLQHTRFSRHTHAVRLISVVAITVGAVLLYSPSLSQDFTESNLKPAIAGVLAIYAFVAQFFYLSHFRESR